MSLALNLSPQQEACVGLDKDTAIIAGAGSGKTTTLAAAVIHDLLVRKIPAEKICVCTFTKSAAANLIEKVTREGTDITTASIGTIDSILFQYLKRNSIEANISPSAQIIGDIEKKDLQRKAWETTLDSLDTDELIGIASFLNGWLEFGPENNKVNNIIDLAESNYGRNFSYSSFPEPDITEALDILKEFLDSERKDNTKKQAVGIYQAFSHREYYAGAVAALQKENKLEDLDFWEKFERIQEYLLSVSFESSYRSIMTVIEKYFQIYSSLKSAAELLDYNDIIEKIDIYQPEFQRLYIDEAQDTSRGQQEILSKLVEPDGVVIIGDPRQSLYSWRNADPEAFSEWAKVLNTKNLSDNYRSSQEIITFINCISALTPGLREDYLDMTVPVKKDPLKGKVSVIALLNQKEEDDTRAPSGPAKASVEATIVTREVLDIMETEQIAPKDVCIICRTNSRVQSYADALKDQGYNSQAIYSQDIVQSEECLPIIDLIKLLDNPYNDQAFISLFSSPLFAIKPERLEEISEIRSRRVFEAKSKARKDGTGDSVTPVRISLLEASRNLEEFDEFTKLFEEIKTNKENYRLIDRTKFFFNRLEYEAIVQHLDITGTSINNINKLYSIIEDIETKDGPLLKVLLQKMSSGIKHKEEPGETTDLIKVMTIHNSKGLEFPFVVYPELGTPPTSDKDSIVISNNTLGIAQKIKSKDYKATKDSVIDSSKAFDKEVALREEVRCLYVGLTRAEQRLLVVFKSKINSKGAEPSTPEAQEFSSYLEKENIKLFDDNFDVIEKNHTLKFEDRNGISSVDLKVIRARGEALKAAEGSKSKVITEQPDLTSIVIPKFKSNLAPIYSQGLNYSQLMDWERCQLKRYLEVDLRLKYVDTSLDLNLISSGSRQAGINIHQALSLIDYNNFPDSADLKEIGEALDTQALNKFLYVKQVKPYLKEYVWSSEIEFSVILGKYRVHGFIDLLGIGNKQAVVIDWKTGDTDLFEKDYLFQQDLYSYAVLKSPETPEVVRYSIFKLDETEPDWSEYKQKDISLLEKNLEKRIDAILHSDKTGRPEPVLDEFTLETISESAVCNGCPGLHTICPSSQVIKEIS